jgi:hypothetical protein
MGPQRLHIATTAEGTVVHSRGWGGSTRRPRRMARWRENFGERECGQHWRVERVSGRCVGTNISRIFSGLSIFSGLRKKTAEGKAIFSSHKKSSENNKLFSAAIKNPPKTMLFLAAFTRPSKIVLVSTASS